MNTRSLQLVLVYLIGSFFLTSCEEPVPLPEAQSVPDMLESVNALRVAGCQCGADWMSPVPALSWSDVLTEAARVHTVDMVVNNFVEHEGKDGKDVGGRLQALGYTYQVAGENIAQGFGSIKEVVSGWKSSVGHCKNMMDPSYTQMGAAELDSYWTQVFAKPQ
ncbi:MAG: CAP domain-containing protein [Bacteroidota bacterium]